jgi:hypothetical protein
LSLSLSLSSSLSPIVVVVVVAIVIDFVARCTVAIVVVVVVAHRHCHRRPSPLSSLLYPVGQLPIAPLPSLLASSVVVVAACRHNRRCHIPSCRAGLEELVFARYCKSHILT